MKHTLLILIFATLCFAQLDDVLRGMKNELSRQEAQNKQREKEFLKNFEHSKKALLDLKKRVKQANELSHKLENTMNKNYETINTKEVHLRNISGDLTDLFSIARQNAIEFFSSSKNNISSKLAQEQMNFLKQISLSKDTLSIADIEKLFMTIMQNIVESSKIRSFKANVVFDDQTKNVDVFKVANFVNFADGVFLKYKNNTISQASQPQSKYQDQMIDFIKADGLSEAVIDPSKGSILELIAQKPSLQERITQGGLIGYVIISLGIIGVLFGIYKWIILFIANKQSFGKNPTQESALKTLVTELKKHAQLSKEALEYKMYELLDKEQDALNRGLGMVKLFAVSSPLLGLLGTVVGMILTFQSITLFGASDPRLMAGGISQALITTMLGLIVAIILLFVHTFLNAKSDAIYNALEQEGLKILSEHK